MTALERTTPQNGYALLEQAVPIDVLDRHERAFGAALNEFDCGCNMSPSRVTPEKRGAFRRELDRLDYGDGAERPLALVPTIRERMGEAFGEEPVLSSTRTSFWEGGDRAAHFDTSVVSTSPEHHAYRTWCALEDIASGNGIFLRRSRYASEPGVR